MNPRQDRHPATRSLTGSTPVSSWRQTDLEWLKSAFSPWRLPNTGLAASPAGRTLLAKVTKHWKATDGGMGPLVQGGVGSLGLPEYKRIQLIRNASRVLVEGEEVVDVTVGIAEVKRNGATKRRRATVLVTDRRVIIFSKRISGYDVQDYAFSRLAGVDDHRGVMSGQLNLRASGGSADIWQVYRPDVERIAQVIRDRIASVRQPAAQTALVSSAPPQDGGGSVADELGRFARLRDEGVITEEEFSAQKAKLLP